MPSKDVAGDGGHNTNTARHNAHISVLEQKTAEGFLWAAVDAVKERNAWLAEEKIKAAIKVLGMT